MVWYHQFKNSIKLAVHVRFSEHVANQSYSNYACVCTCTEHKSNDTGVAKILLCKLGIIATGGKV